jgi:hypothetical protein
MFVKVKFSTVWSIYMTPLQLLDFQKLQIILSRFDSFFGFFMMKPRLSKAFYQFSPTLSKRKWRTDLFAVESYIHTSNWLEMLHFGTLKGRENRGCWMGYQKSM